MSIIVPEIQFINLAGDVDASNLKQLKAQFKAILPKGQKIVITGGNLDVGVNTLNLDNGKKLFVVSLNPISKSRFADDDGAISEQTIKDVRKQVKAYLPKGYKLIITSGAWVSTNSVSL